MSKTYIDDNGYLRFKDSDLLVHRWVMANTLGRELYPEEVVHHRDRDKLNNDPSNLKIYKNQRKHNKRHERDGY